MSVNKYKPHLYVLPEDDADRQITNGFVLHPSILDRQVQVVQPAGGWTAVLSTFVDDFVPLLGANTNTHIVMIVDFDGKDVTRRRAEFESQTPVAMRARVFVIGPRDTPEALRQSIGQNYEEIGQSLAHDCDRNLVDTWNHAQLIHNEPDRLRLVDVAKPFLFL